MDSLAEQLRCGNCNDYLILPPIVQLDAGTSACGNCTPSSSHKNPNGSVVSEMTLEKALRRLSFPCKYKLEGCQARLFFGYRNHEEANCVYRPLTCPTGNCPWLGSMFGVPKHFAEAHSTMIKNALNFKLQIGYDSEETILAVIYKIPYLVKYFYNADQRKLYIEINSLTTIEIFYKIWLFNNGIYDNCVSMKKEKCLPYISQFCNGLTLNLNKYLPVLKNPNCLLIRVQMVLKEGHENDVIVPATSAGVSANNTVEGIKYVCLPLMPIVKRYHSH